VKSTVQEWDEEHALHPHPGWARLPQSPTTSRLVQSPTTRIYQLDGSAVLRRGGLSVDLGDHVTFSFVPPGMKWALVGLLAGVAPILASTARSASSFGVRR
jgi:hypothetical protein